MLSRVPQELTEFKSDEDDTNKTRVRQEEVRHADFSMHGSLKHTHALRNNMSHFTGSS